MTAQRTIELVSPNKRLWLSLETNVDEYNQQGGMRTVSRGERVRFEAHRATVADTPGMREQLAAHSGYGRTFFFKDDPTAPPIAGGVGVVTGQMHGASSRKAAEVPPTPDWDETGPRELRSLIIGGRIDLQEAMSWESNHLARAQVVTAIASAIRAAKGDGPPEEPDDAEGEGHIRTIPEDAGGI